jgi:hypothetical protein
VLCWNKELSGLKVKTRKLFNITIRKGDFDARHDKKRTGKPERFLLSMHRQGDR